MSSAVSYTHLDVYKRQVYGDVENARNTFRLYDQARKELVGKVQQGALLKAAIQQWGLAQAF